MIPDPEMEHNALGPMLYGTALAAGVALLGLGTAASLMPGKAAGAYGVPAPDEWSRAYMAAAGVRDMFAGSVVLAFARERNRRALGTAVALTSMIAVGDAVVAGRHSPNPKKVLPTHIAGIVGCVGFAVLLLRRG